MGGERERREWGKRRGEEIYKRKRGGGKIGDQGTEMRVDGRGRKKRCEDKRSM